MQFSTDLPCGVRVVEYIENRGDSHLPMNVSPEADATYIAEKGLRIGPVTLTSWPVGTCDRCGGTIHNAPYLNAEQEFCSRACRDGEKTDVRRGRPRLTPKQKAESKVNRRQYQKTLMQKRRDPVLANNSPQPIESTGFTNAVFGTCDKG